GPSFRVRNLNGRSIEPEERPHLLLRDGERSVLQLRLELLVVRVRDRHDDERVLRDAPLESRDGSDDRGSPLELEILGTVGLWVLGLVHLFTVRGASRGGGGNLPEQPALASLPLPRYSSGRCRFTGFSRWLS